MIVFRVFSTPNSGLGHIVRCQYLAQALQQKGQQVYFIGDVIADQVTSFLNEVPFAQLYPRTPEQWDAKCDAQATLALIEKERLHPDWVVVDHYHLAAAWETQLIQSGFRVMAIDDLVRPHQSQALLDFKWRGSAPEWVYADKVSPNTQLLLGPQYSLISPQLTAQSSLQHPQSSSTEAYTVLLSLGGGGDALILQQLLVALLSECKQSSASSSHQTIHFQVVIGPLLQNKEGLTAQFSNQEWPGCRLTFIEGKTNLDTELTNCDLYLGLAGGLVYGLRAVKKPAITFSLSDNQNTDQSLLDAIGHYFHLNQIHVQDFAKLARWVRVCQQNPQRIQKLFAFSNVLIDTLGARRVADYMISGILSSLPSITSKNYDWTELAGGRRLRAVEDADLNHYLASRNLSENCQNMLDIKPIQPIDHALWWFNTPRRSFLMTQAAGEPLLYIWDEIKQVDDKPFLIGGWFVCDGQTAFQEAMVALDWQLKQCAKDYPDVPWVAVISRQNKYVKLMNDYFGFKEIEPGGRYYKAVTTLFPKASQQDFYYVYKDES